MFSFWELLLTVVFHNVFTVVGVVFGVCFVLGALCYPPVTYGGVWVTCSEVFLTFSFCFLPQRCFDTGFLATFFLNFFFGVLSMVFTTFFNSVFCLWFCPMVDASWCSLVPPGSSCLYKELHAC